MSHSLTSSIDTAQVVLYVFWVFFAGLIIWLRREDRREGYPLEHERTAVEGPRTRIPRPKEFLLPDDMGVRQAPDFVRDRREIRAELVSRAPGAPLEPVGEPLLAGVGPASFAERIDRAELLHEDGKPAIVPMRVAPGFRIDAGPDLRGWKVLGADKQQAGTVTDFWVDRADLMIRYVEIQLPVALAVAPEAGEDAALPDSTPRTRLIPITMLGIDERTKSVRVHALRASQFEMVPTLRNPEQITVLEEERVSAFYAGGWFYSEPQRREAVL
ncbi:MAG: PRC-barrel domain-containing protein [Deltaproteobacteria bacterium]|nr:PRC-barrel domain-containing protein [Nannocystaceae bacterium]